MVGTTTISSGVIFKSILFVTITNECFAFLCLFEICKNSTMSLNGIGFKLVKHTITLLFLSYHITRPIF